ncbi:putative transcriptional regulator [Flavobacterium aquidurense]|uniref:Putative transcriptional regulator n=1 Tax=Flavobacterium aquidurense TaxID=362413 RepID=A0A0Q0RSX9_9FLAO|nr:putative transcriptional regulator [Flavobacterium aquidurense]
MKAKRKEKKISQVQFAELLFMDQSQYNRREQGHIKISDAEWIKMAKLLQVSVDEIYESDIENYQTDNKNEENKFKNTIEIIIKISIKEAQELSNKLIYLLKNNTTK